MTQQKKPKFNDLDQEEKLLSDALDEAIENNQLKRSGDPDAAGYFRSIER